MSTGGQGVSGSVAEDGTSSSQGGSQSINDKRSAAALCSPVDFSSDAMHEGAKIKLKASEVPLAPVPVRVPPVTLCVLHEMQNCCTISCRCTGVLMLQLAEMWEYF